MSAPIDALPPPNMANEPTRPAPVVRTLWQKVQSIALNVLKALGAIVLFLLNPSLFLIGYFTGIIWETKVQETVEKIVWVWKLQPWAMTFLGVGAAFLALPASLATASVFYGAYLGSEMCGKAKKQHASQVYSF